jgi:hypothetical protein
MPAMDKSCPEDNLARCIIDKGEPCRFAARINLDPKWLPLEQVHCTFQHNSKRVVLEYRCLPRREKHTRLRWMYGVQWPFVGINNKDLTQVASPFAPRGASACAGNVFLDRLSDGF